MYNSKIPSAQYQPLNKLSEKCTHKVQICTVFGLIVRPLLFYKNSPFMLGRIFQYDGLFGLHVFQDSFLQSLSHFMRVWCSSQHEECM